MIALQATRDATFILFKAAFQPKVVVDPQNFDTAMLSCMIQTLETEFSGPALGSSMLSTTLHLSVKAVLRLFEGTRATVTSVVRKKRLAHARQNLLNGTETISTIAQRWCFSDASHFSRAFKKHYRVAPASSGSDEAYAWRRVARARCTTTSVNARVPRLPPRSPVLLSGSATADSMAC